MPLLRSGKSEDWIGRLVRSYMHKHNQQAKTSSAFYDQITESISMQADARVQEIRPCNDTILESEQIGVHS